MTWAQAFRDVGIRFIASSKFIPFFASLPLIIIAARTPPGQLIELAKVLFVSKEGHESLSTLGIIIGFGGWALALLFLLTAIAVVVILRKSLNAEIQRVAIERNELQELLLNQSVQHTKLPPR